MLDEQIFKMQNNSDKLFVLLFLYKRNMKIRRPMTDNEIAVYGIDFIVSDSPDGVSTTFDDASPFGG